MEAKNTSKERARQNPLSPTQNEEPPQANEATTTFCEQTPETKSETAPNTPAIDNWKSAPLFSLLGATVGSMLEFLILSVVGALTNSTLGAPAAFFAIVSVYALIIYPSYFTPKPLIKSSRVISFLNYSVAGIVFGLLWNNNLRNSNLEKKPKKGSSYIVVVVLAALLLCSSIASGPHELPNENGAYEDPLLKDPLVNISTSDTTNSNKNGSYRTNNPESVLYRDDELGISFRYPSDWTQETLSEDREYLRWKAHPNSTTLVGVQFGTSEIEETDEASLTADDFAGMITELLPDCSNERVEQITLGENDYWKISGSGTYENSVAMYMTQLAHIENGRYYAFQYVAFSEEQGDLYYEDLESIATSAIFH